MIAKIKQLFTRLFPYDKLLHYVFIGVYPTMILSKFLAWYWVLPIILIVAVLIELYDKNSENGTPEIRDITYAMAGAISVIIINLIKTIV